MIGAFHIRGEVNSHSQEITDLDWSPDGKLLATCSRDGTVQLFRVPKGKAANPELTWSAAHTDEVLSVRFSRDGKLLASGGRDCRVYCWDVANGELANTFFGPSSFRSVTWSPDGQFIAAAQTNVVHVFDRGRDRSTADWLDMHTRRIRRVQWLPDGSILSGGEDSQLIHWNLVPRRGRAFPVPGDGITDIAVGENRIAIACRDGTLRLWSIFPFVQLGEIPVASTEIRQTAFFLNERFVAATGVEGWVTLHERETRSLNCEFRPPPKVGRLAIHPVRSILAAAVTNRTLLLDVDVSPTPAVVVHARSILRSASAVDAPLASLAKPPLPNVRSGAHRNLGSATKPKVTKPTTSLSVAAKAAVVEGKLDVLGLETAPTKILFMAANPRNEVRIQLTQEASRIKEALASARRKFELVEEHAVRLDSLQKILLRHAAAIVHFSGHGSNAGALMFVDTQDNATEVDPEALADMFRLVGTARLVVLNACYSRPQAELLAEHVPVVGMTSAIPDDTAIAFSKSLYESFGEGVDVARAVELARTYIRLNKLPGSEIPELLFRSG